MRPCWLSRVVDGRFWRRLITITRRRMLFCPVAEQGQLTLTIFDVKSGTVVQHVISAVFTPRNPAVGTFFGVTALLNEMSGNPVNLPFQYVVGISWELSLDLADGCRSVGNFWHELPSSSVLSFSTFCWKLLDSTLWSYVQHTLLATTSAFCVELLGIGSHILFFSWIPRIPRSFCIPFRSCKMPDNAWMVTANGLLLAVSTTDDSWLEMLLLLIAPSLFVRRKQVKWRRGADSTLGTDMWLFASTAIGKCSVNTSDLTAASLLGTTEDELSSFPESINKDECSEICQHNKPTTWLYHITQQSAFNVISQTYQCVTGNISQWRHKLNSIIFMSAKYNNQNILGITLYFKHWQHVEYALLGLQCM